MKIILLLIVITVVALCVRYIKLKMTFVDIPKKSSQDMKDYTGKGWVPEPTTTKFTIPGSKSVPGNQCMKFGEDLVCK
jgi:hypothetical protein